jgi:AbrB family looped-hinge helix DNA binding protein
MPNEDRKYVRIEHNGKVTLPAEIRRNLGLKKGDLVAVEQTSDGVLLTPQTATPARSLERIGETLEQQGISLDKLLARARTGQTADGIPLRDYTDEELAQFLADDAMTEEEKSIARRFGWDEPKP